MSGARDDNAAICPTARTRRARFLRLAFANTLFAFGKLTTCRLQDTL